MVILVDGSNLFLSSKRLGKNVWPPDLARLLLPHIEGDLDQIHSIYYFTSVDRRNQAQRRALNHMAKSGVIVHDFDLKDYSGRKKCAKCNRTCEECGRDLRKKPHKEKMVDIALATKAIELAYQDDPHCDTFVIVSGDKDLIPAIRLLRERLGKAVIIAGFRHVEPEFNSLAYELDKEVDGMINLCSLV